MQPLAPGARRRWRLAAASTAVAAAGVTIGFGVAGELGGRGLGSALAAADPWWLAAAGGLTAAGYAVAGQAVRGASGLLTRPDAVLLPYASAAANRVLPAGAGGVAVTARVLVTRGAAPAAAAAIAVAAALSTGLVGIALVAVGLLCAGTGAVPLAGLHLSRLPQVVPPLPVLVGAAAAVAAAAVAGAWLGARRPGAWRARFGRVLRRRVPGWAGPLPGPAVLVRFVAFEVINRLCQVAALVACTAAVGQQLDVAPAVVALAASGVAASLIPVAGGGGGVEVTLALALHAAGMSVAAAGAATLLVRVIGYWGPALLGIPAIGVLLGWRRRASQDRPTSPTSPTSAASPACVASPAAPAPARAAAATRPTPVRAAVCAAVALLAAASAAIYG